VRQVADVAAIQPAWKYIQNQKYLTVYDLARALDEQPSTVARWVRRWMDNDQRLAAGREPGKGYKLPLAYLLVGRGWSLTEDPHFRAIMLRLLPDRPDNYLVVVGNQGWTCYSWDQARELAFELALGKPPEWHRVVTVFYLGPTDDQPLER
jgi:transposase-like protein